LYCHSNFPKFRRWYCHTTLFPKFIYFCCQTSRFPVFKYFYYNTVLSKIQMFVLEHNTLFSHRPCCKKGAVYKISSLQRDIKVLCFTENKCFEVGIFHTYWLFLKIELLFFTYHRGCTQLFISQWQLVPLYKTEAILRYLHCHTMHFADILEIIQAI
jgi:hypothetical protein